MKAWYRLLINIILMNKISQPLPSKYGIICTYKLATQKKNPKKLIMNQYLENLLSSTNNCHHQLKTYIFFFMFVTFLILMFGQKPIIYV